jgi:recombination protein RecT
MADKNEVATLDFKDFGGSLIRCYERVQDSLPPGFNINRAAQNAVTVMNAHPEYAQYGAGQLWECFRQSAILDLDISLNEAYIVPYKGKLKLMTSYMGDKLIAQRHSVRKVRDIHGYLVYEGDQFEATQKSEDWEWVFKPNPFKKGKMVGAFAYVIFEDGGNRLEFMDTDELEAARKQSNASNSPAWNRFTNEMYRKVIIHRICKHIPTDLTAEQKDIVLSGIDIEKDPKNIRDKEVEDMSSEIFDMDALVED